MLDDKTQTYGLYIHGEEVAPAGGTISRPRTRIPARPGATSPAATSRRRRRAVASAKRAFEGEWSTCRRHRARQADAQAGRPADRQVRPRLAEIERRDNGKLAAEVVAQVKLHGDYFHYYAGLADKVESHVIPTDKAGVFAYTKYEAKGVVGIITPWNSPLTLTSWKLAPALAAGCTAVIKPSEFTSASMVEFAALFTEAGFPPGVVNVSPASARRSASRWSPTRRAAHRLHRRRDRRPKIYELAANLKTVTLELGGKSPNIVFDDADLDRPSKAWSRASSRPPARAARPARACCCRTASTTPSSSADRLREDRQAGRPGLDGHPDRPGGDQAAVRQDHGLYRDRQGRGRALRARRQGRGRTSGPAVRRADHLHRRPQRHAHRPGGGVRPGPVGDPVHRRGRRPPHRQRHRFRPGRRGLDPGPEARHADDRQAQGRHGLGQQLPRHQLHLAVRRLQASGIGRESGMDAIREYLDVKCVWISSDLEVPNPFIRR
jgi:hypothetical protein